MNWEDVLITLYLDICKEFHKKLWINCQRFSNGGYRRFSDEEVLTVYMFGVMKRHRELKDIHRFAKSHLAEWFPNMPKYAGFVHRVNRLSEAFRGLIEIMQKQKVPDEDAESEYLVDSFPVILAQHNHAYTAKVASEVASKSYHSTKKMYYYGVKAHMVARRVQGKLPDLEILFLEEAGRQDGPVFDQMRPMMHDNLVFADQAYKRPDAKQIEIEQNLKVLTPIGKTKGQKELEPAQRMFSKAVSRMRQPIEALFAWIHRVTGIENAGLVRSTPGLLVHIFGKIATAMLLRARPEFRL
jgi:hypothetical protein